MTGVYIIESEMITVTRDELKKLFDDETFRDRLGEVNSAEELQALLTSRGINISLAEINEAANAEKELSEDELDDVTGGGVNNRWAKAWRHLMIVLMSIIDRRQRADLDKYFITNL